MATYLEWATRIREKSRSRVIWVCGPSTVLREVVVDDVVVRSGAQSEDRDRVDTLDGIGAVWDAVNALPYLDRPRLVVVRGAERLARDLRPLEAWVSRARYRPKTHLCFVADEDDWPATRTPSLREASALTIVRCTPVQPAKFPVVAASWLPAGTGSEVVSAVAARSVGDIAALRQICRRIALLETPVDVDLVAEAWPEAPGSAYVRYVVAGRKDRAVIAAGQVEDPVGTLRLLEWTLDALARIHRARVRGIADNRIRSSENLPHGIVERYGSYAASYDIVRVRKNTGLVANSYRHLESGREGVLEVLAILW